MKRYFYVFIVFILLFLYACTVKEENNLIGNWEGKDAQGTKQELIFYENSLAIWKMNTLVGNETYHLKYFIDKKASPMIIQIYGFEKGFLKGKTLYGIFRIENNNTFYLDANIGESSEITPTEFTEETVIFKRVINDKN